MLDRNTLLRKVALIFAVLTVLVILYPISDRKYLLFHSVVELFSIIVGCCIFIIALNARRFIDNNFYMVLAFAYLFVSALDLLHTLAYTGMEIFIGYGTNLPTQLWISARYLESVSFLSAFLFLKHKVNIQLLFSGYFLLFCLILGTIFYGKVFPTCYDETTKLTLFKKTSEYIIVGILLFALIQLLRNRDKFDHIVIRWIGFALISTMISELFFTLYTSPYGTANIIGHLLKLVSFYLIYKAFIEIGLKEPYNLLFRNLKLSNEKLQQARDELEVRVQERTADLISTVDDLKEEIKERQRLEHEVLDISAMEQRRMGQDLHDGLGQLLTGISFLGKKIEQKLSEQSRPEAADAAELSKYVKQALNHTRTLARVLNPVGLEEEGLMASLQKLAANTEEFFDVSCTFQCQQQVLVRDNRIATHLYHIAQEAITNSIKHGQARHLLLSLLPKDESQVVLAIKDDGQGRLEDFDQGQGIGLQIMKYRARSMGGILEFQQVSPRGILVTCSFSAKSRKMEDNP